MIDTAYFRVDQHEIPTDFLSGISPNEPFSPLSMPGFVGRVVTTKPTSVYYKQGAKYMLTLRHLVYGVTVSGPIFYDRLHWGCDNIRASIPKLAHLSDGCLPATELDYQVAIFRLRTILRWLPEDWHVRAKVKELHLSMNFDFSGRMSAKSVMGAHHLMRHPRVRLEPTKFKPFHHTLYWKGRYTVIALYEKTTEVCERLARERNMSPAEIRRRYNLNELIRLEFRLKTTALNSLFECITPRMAHSVASVSSMPLSCLNATLFEKMFRWLALEFGDLPIRRPRRLTAKTLLAMQIQNGAVIADGTPIADFALIHMPSRQWKEAKAMSGKVDLGGNVFRWKDWLGESGWGPWARPKPECFGGIAQA